MADLVTVFIPRDEPENLMVKGLLEGAKIQYYSKNEAVQSLIGLGHIGSSFNLAAGPIQIQVSSDDFEKARELINEHFTQTIDEFSIPEFCPACESKVKGQNQCPDCGLVFINEVKQKEPVIEEHCSIVDCAKKSLILSIFWGAGFTSLASLYYAIKALISINESKKKGWVLFLSISGIILAVLGILLGVQLIRTFYDF